MRLLASLASGNAAWAGGAVEVFQRGTTTRATLYSDFEALNPTLLSPVTLDAHGSASLYVGGNVDVVVSDYTGTEVARWTEGDSASSVEVVSSEFSGTDYETGASGAGEPAQLVEVLEELKSGVESAAAAATGSSLFFNVKDVAYGAVGDGVTDDTAAVRAAIAAAVAAGGGVVWFPAGTYLCSSNYLGISSLVSLQGPGSSCTQIRATSFIDTSIVLVTLSNADDAVLISGIDFEFNDTSTDPCVSIIGGTAAGRCVLRGCTLNANGNAGSGVKATGNRYTHVVLDNCALFGGAKKCVDADSGGSTSPTLTMVGCRVRHDGDTISENNVEIAEGSIVGCVFHNDTLLNAGDVANVRVGSGAIGPVVVAGSLFTGAGASFYAINSDESVLSESGNYFGTNLSVITDPGSSGSDTTQKQILGSRGYRTRSSAGGSVTCSPQTWRTEHIECNGVDITASLSGAPPGTAFSLVVSNAHASTSVVVTLVGVHGSDTFTVSAHTVGLQEFEYVFVNGVSGWMRKATLFLTSTPWD